MKRIYVYAAALSLIAASCTDDVENNLSWEIGEGIEIDYPEEYFAGGQLGTTNNNSSTAFKQPTASVENAGMVTAFNEGEYLFENDFNTKVNYAKGFAESGNKIKVSVRFKGREKDHPEIGYELMERFKEACKYFAGINGSVKVEGRSLSMILDHHKKINNNSLKKGSEAGTDALTAQPLDYVQSKNS